MADSRRGTGASTYESLVERAARERDVVGVVLGGGRGKGVHTERSDYDVYVVLDDPGELPGTLAEIDDEQVEVLPTSLEELQLIAEDWLHPLRWNRYTFAHVAPVLDRTDGRLQLVLDQKELVPSDHLASHLRESLDAYVNLAYRSLKNHADGEDVGAALDAAESVAPLLDYLFALDGRIRPYNKFLRWELDRHELPTLDVSTTELVAAVVKLGEGDTSAQRRMFRHAEAAAARCGLADVIDAWGPAALAVLREPPDADR